MLKVEFLYASAHNAGLLKPVIFEGKTVMVDLRAPDEEVLGGMGMSRDTSIRYPASAMTTLAAGHVLEIQGQPHRVREVVALGDGSEMRATLMRL
jgi:hypothetical protein